MTAGGALDNALQRVAGPAQSRGGGEGYAATAILAAVSGGFLLMVLLSVIPLHASVTALVAYAACLAIILAVHLVVVPRHAHLTVAARSGALMLVALCTLLPTAWAGQAWLGTWVFLVASAILLLPAPAAVFASGAVCLGGTLIQAEISSVGLSVYTGLGIAGGGLAIAGLTQMSSLLSSLRRTRAALAATAVLDERQRFQRQLRETLARALDVISLRATRAEAFLRERDTRRAEAELTQLRNTTQTALREVRAIARTYRSATADSLPRPAGPAAAPADATGSWRRPSLSFAVLFGVLGMRAADCLLGSVLSAPQSTSALRGVLVVLAFAIQIVVFSRSVSYSYGWRITAWLAQGGLGVAGLLLTPRETSVPSMLGFFAGTALLLLPRAAGIAIATGAVAASGLWLTSPSSLAEAAYPYFSSGNTALIVYGLTTLHFGATRLREAETELGARAATQERARLARDLHDFLGLTLSGIALKSHLAAKIVADDVDGARTEVLEILPIADRARTEIAMVASASADMSLEEELTAALANLATAGVGANVRRVGPPPPSTHVYPLATALRESVTNALRHAEPTTCQVLIEVDDANSRLRVTNDGVTWPPPPGHPAGTGLTNIRKRVVECGGSVGTTASADSFTLEVTLPMRGPAGPTPP